MSSNDISTEGINWLYFFLRLRKREKVKMKLNVNTMNSTLVPEWKLQTRWIAWRCIQCDTAMDERWQWWKRNIENWKQCQKIDVDRFYIVNCVWKIKWKSGRNETRNNCRRLSLYFTFVALDSCTISFELQRNAETPETRVRIFSGIETFLLVKSS